MFLRKLFSAENKLTWVLVDLCIVIIGVYGAFLIQNYAENEKNNLERDRVLTALKFEIELFRFSMTEISIGMNGYSNQLKNKQNKGEYADFSDYRFIEPQYSYQIIEYSTNNQNIEIIDFELYNVLQKLFSEIKKMEHVERLLTETARRYRTLPSNINKLENSYKLAWTENYDNFKRFVILINDRGQIAARIAEASSNALPLVNNRLGLEKTKQIETEILISNIDRVSNEQEAVYLVKQYFPNFTEKEVIEIYRKYSKPTQTKSDTVPN